VERFTTKTRRYEVTKKGSNHGLTRIFTDYLEPRNDTNFHEESQVFSRLGVLDKRSSRSKSPQKTSGFLTSSERYVFVHKSFAPGAQALYKKPTEIRLFVSEIDTDNHEDTKARSNKKKVRTTDFHGLRINCSHRAHRGHRVFNFLDRITGLARFLFTL